MAIKHVDRFTTPLRDDGGNRIATLLWGDLVHVLGTSGDAVHVRARRREGWVEAAALSDRSLLEIYVSSTPPSWPDRPGSPMPRPCG